MYMFIHMYMYKRLNMNASRFIFWIKLQKMNKNKLDFLNAGTWKIFVHI